MVEIPESIRTLLQNQQGSQALEELRNTSGLESRQALFIEALCHSMNQDYVAASAVFEGIESKDDATLLLRARVAFELGSFEKTESFLGQMKRKKGDEYNTLLFSTKARKVFSVAALKSSSFDWLDVQDRFRELIFSDQQKNGEDALRKSFRRLDPALFEILSIHQRMLTILDTADRPINGVIEDLKSLIQQLEELRPRGQKLRRDLTSTTGLIMSRNGLRSDAFSMVQEQLGVQGDRGDIEDWLAWGQFLKRASFPEADVLQAFLSAHSCSQSRGSNDGDLSSTPETALALAEAYADYGYTVEARSLLHEYYDKGLRDEALKESMRAVMLREAMGVSDIDFDKAFDPDDLPEEFCDRAQGIEFDKELLSLLFIKAERCYERLGEAHGKEIITTAKKLKRALKDKDTELARSYESRLSRYVVRLYEEFL
ncbi:MAG: hypothetical protein P1V97_25340 [Planctomycetota bacterium]|nr:hypothetical protein [Planctomycetota bacterium]